MQFQQPKQATVYLLIFVQLSINLVLFYLIDNYYNYFPVHIC